MIDNQMTIFSDISGILDSVVKDIFKRVAGLVVYNTTACEMWTGDLWTLSVTTQGDYHLALVLRTNSKLLRVATQNMKHGAVPTDADIPIYMTEFFNILCGHVISRINVKNHTKARFGVPRLVKIPFASGMEANGENRQEFYYNCDYGPIEIDVLSGIADDYVLA